MTEAERTKNGEDWASYRRSVLGDVAQVVDAIAEMNKEIGKLRVQVAVLKVSVGVWLSVLSVFLVKLLTAAKP